MNVLNLDLSDRFVLLDDALGLLEEPDDRDANTDKDEASNHDAALLLVSEAHGEEEGEEDSNDQIHGIECSCQGSWLKGWLCCE